MNSSAGYNSHNAQSARHGYALVAAARWESDNIVEWLLYYQLLGFSHVYLYCNDDDPQELFERTLPFTLGKSPFVTFNFFPLQGQQEQMYFHFLNNYRKECEWACFIDCDEYLVLKYIDNIDTFLIPKFEQADAVHFHSVTAGHCGYVERPEGNVISNFCYRARDSTLFTKSIFRTASVDESKIPSCLGVGLHHNIEFVLHPTASVVNVRGTSMRGYYHDPLNSFQKLYTPEFRDFMFETAFIFHVGMKSQRDLLRRVERGLAGTFDGQIHWKMLHDSGPAAIEAHFAPLNEVEDRYLQLLWRKWTSRGSTHALTPIRPGINIAIGCRCTQSSVSIHSRQQTIELDAAGLVDGKPNGLHHHCTESEDNPWWEVDLGQPTTVHQIWVYNRVDGARDRFRNFRIAVRPSADAAWSTLDEKADNKPFGGVDGAMYIWEGHRAEVRFIRLVKNGHGFMDLDQVEVFKAEANDAT